MSKSLILWEIRKKGAERYSCMKSKAEMREIYKTVYGDMPLSSFTPLRIAQTIYSYAYAMDRASSLLGNHGHSGQTKEDVESAVLTLMCNSDAELVSDHNQVVRLYEALYEVSPDADVNDLTLVRDMRADMSTILNYYTEV